MGKLKSFGNYLIGRDILETRRKYLEALEKVGEQSKLIGFLGTISMFGMRYLPVLMEIDGIRRLADGEYGGGIELLLAESVRIHEHFWGKRQKEYVDFCDRIEEAKRMIERSSREFKEDTDRIIKKLKAI